MPPSRPLLLFSTLTLALSCAAAQPPSASPSTPAPADGQKAGPTWRSLDPDLFGKDIWNLLVSDKVQSPQPLRTAPLDKSAGRILSFRVSNDGTLAVVLLTASDGSQSVRAIDLADGKMRELGRLHTPARSPRTALSPDGKTVFAVDDKGKKVRRFETASAKELAALEVPKDQELKDVFVTPAGAVVGLARANLVKWTGDKAEPDLVRSFTTADGFQALAAAPDKSGAAAVLVEFGEGKGKLARVSLENQAEKVEESETWTNEVPIVCTDGAATARLRKNADGAIKHLSLTANDTFKESSSTPLPFPFFVMALRALEGGKLLLLDNMSQTVFLFNPETKQFTHRFGQEVGGCHGFAISDNGRWLLAPIGPWEEGTLRPERWALWELPR